jgi:hypothetical protein
VVIVLDEISSTGKVALEFWELMSEFVAEVIRFGRSGVVDKSVVNDKAEAEGLRGGDGGLDGERTVVVLSVMTVVDESFDDNVDVEYGDGGTCDGGVGGGGYADADPGAEWSNNRRSTIKLALRMVTVGSTGIRHSGMETRSIGPIGKEGVMKRYRKTGARGLDVSSSVSYDGKIYCGMSYRTSGKSPCFIIRQPSPVKGMWLTADMD